MSGTPTSASDENVTWQGTVINSSPRQSKFTVKVSNNLTLDFTPVNGFQSEGNVVSQYSVTPGDRAWVTFIPGGKTVGKVEVRGEYFAGSLIFINNQKLILSCGQQIYMTDNPRIILNGSESEIREIKTGTRTFVRVDPETNLAGTVEVIDTDRYKPAEQDKRFNYNRISVHRISSSGTIDKMEAVSSSFRQGDKIQVELQGTPGKTAVLVITGNAADIPLKEIRPGVYRGEYVFSRGDVRRSYLILKMYDDKDDSYRIYPQAIDVACSPPEIKLISPIAGRRVNDKETLVYAEFLSKGSLVDASSVMLYLNGRQVTTGLDRTVNSVRADIAPQVKPGENIIEVRLRDEAGNSASEKWNFSVKSGS
jgi:hypothetical protein